MVSQDPGSADMFSTGCGRKVPEIPSLKSEAMGMPSVMRLYQFCMNWARLRMAQSENALSGNFSHSGLL